MKAINFHVPSFNGKKHYRSSSVHSYRFKSEFPRCNKQGDDCNDLLKYLLEIDE